LCGVNVSLTYLMFNRRRSLSQPNACGPLLARLMVIIAHANQLENAMLSIA